MEDLSPKISLDFRALFESLPGMFVVVLPDFAIAAASEDYLKGAMRTREEIAGRNVFEAFPENPAFAAGADGVNRLRASLEKVLATKKPDRMPTQRYDVRGDGLGKQSFSHQSESARSRQEQK